MYNSFISDKFIIAIYKTFYAHFQVYGLSRVSLSYSIICCCVQLPVLVCHVPACHTVLYVVVYINCLSWSMVCHVSACHIICCCLQLPVLVYGLPRVSLSQRQQPSPPPLSTCLGCPLGLEVSHYTFLFFIFFKDITNFDWTKIFYVNLMKFQQRFRQNWSLFIS